MQYILFSCVSREIERDRERNLYSAEQAIVTDFTFLLIKLAKIQVGQQVVQFKLSCWVFVSTLPYKPKRSFS